MHTEEAVTKLSGLCTKKKKQKQERNIFFRRIELQLEEWGPEDEKQRVKII